MKQSETFQQKQDWKVLAVNDYQKSTAAFGKKERVGSIKICNPRYVSKILVEDANHGLTPMMPLSIDYYEDKDGQVYVSQMNIQLMGMSGNDVRGF
ncbi:MAG: hypothetical protein C1941_01315 [Prosthecochloris sp.]|nr:hypothetical protein [Prosthecochloris sp.]